jgi:hypothetical protein
MLQPAVGFLATAPAIAMDRRPAMRAACLPRPGIFHADTPAGWRNQPGGWRFPVVVMLPASMAVSAGLWAAIALAINALI